MNEIFNIRLSQEENACDETEKELSDGRGDDGDG